LKEVSPCLFPSQHANALIKEKAIKRKKVLTQEKLSLIINQPIKTTNNGSSSS